MNSRTKNILIIASCVFLGGVATLAFLLYKISTGGEKLDSYITALSEKTAREVTFLKIKRLVEDTQSDRAELASAFFADESDSISFLGKIENFAKEVRVDLKTEGLDKKLSSDKSLEYITMTFVYSGTKTQIENFTTYLETPPYHGKVESLTLEQETNGRWRGMLTLNISITPS